MTASLIVVKIRFKSFVLIYLTCANSREKSKIEDVKLVLKPRLKHFEKYLKIPIRSFKGSVSLKEKTFLQKFYYCLSAWKLHLLSGCLKISELLAKINSKPQSLYNARISEQYWTFDLIHPPHMSNLNCWKQSHGDVL